MDARDNLPPPTPTGKPGTCLVTGGAGFIGSHLVKLLIDQGHTVRVIDNLSTGRLENLEHLRHEPHLTFHQLDINQHTEIAPLFRDVQHIFHLAALADIVPSIERPINYHHANVDGTVSVLEAARQAGVKSLVYAASSSCYGLPDIFPTPEEAPASPQYPYALTKYLAEQYALHWHKVYGLPVVSLRLFNAYGPRARSNGTYGAVFGVFLAQKLAGRPCTVVGDGTQTRDFTFVTDIARAFLAAARAAEHTGGRALGRVYNVGSGGTYAINHLVELLGCEKVFLPRRPGEPDCTFADITRIGAELGWRPQIDFEMGVRYMLEVIDDYRDAPLWDPDSIAGATRRWFECLADPQPVVPAGSR